MSKSCSGVLDDLVACVAKSDCGRGADPAALKACVADAAQIKECAALREVSLRLPDSAVTPPHKTTLPQLYARCKRGAVDMRTRIRGNKGY